MKKMYLFIFVICSFLFPSLVSANTIDSIDTVVDIDENGNGHVTETWVLDVNEGSESYHSFGNMTDREITNFKVVRDDTLYTFVDSWNINASKAQKANKNGINYVSGGLELCWGIEYGKHTYTVSYVVNNLVWQYSDNQIMYFSFLPQNMNPAPKAFNLTVQSDKELSNLKYSSYGFVSENSIENGKVYFKSSKPLSSSDYVVALVGFPNETFTNLSINRDASFDDVSGEALEGATLNNKDSGIDIWEWIGILFWPILIVIIAIISLFASRGRDRIDKSEYVIPKKVNNFRDIPFNKDFLLAYYIALDEKIFDKKNLIGTYLLKWIKEERIKMVPTEGGVLDFNKNDNYYIDLNNLGSSTSTVEQSLITKMKNASKKENKLTPKEFKKYCKDHYTEIDSWLDLAYDTSKNMLISKGYIAVSKENYSKKKTRNVYKYTKKLAEQVIYLKGLKQFLNDFSLIDEKKAIEVHMWDEYLIFAEAMGIADKVAKQFKQFYPEEYKQMDMYESAFLVSTFSTSSVNAAASAKAAASSGGSFSGGGFSSGGFSSGGGGVR